jgi:glycosyltransferase involved in cell wall biosynthesis
MPVRNGMPFLAEAVDSVRSQTWLNWELIVVDDHSTDSAATYVGEIGDPRIRVLNNAGDGFDAALATGIQAARGEFVARLDADDIAMPERLQVQAGFLAANPEFVGVGTQVEFIAEAATVSAFAYPQSPSRVLANLRSGRVTLCDSAMMFRRYAARQVRSKTPGPGADFDFYLRLAAFGRLGNLPHRMVRVRVSKSSMSFSRAERQICGIAFALACDRARRSGTPEPDFADFQRAWDNRSLWRRLPAKLRTRHQQFFRNAILHRGAGNTLQALACLSASAALWPPAAWYQLKRALARENAHSHEVQA